MAEPKRFRPLLVGSVALDILHHGLIGENLPPVHLRWGGVVSNMACAMGVLGARPYFVSAEYEGELRYAVAAHLRRNDVRWTRVASPAPMPLFHARVATDGVHAEHFIGDEALRMLTPDALGRHRRRFDQASVIVACTDLPVDTLSWLGREAAGRAVPYWVLSADPRQAGKLGEITPFPDCVALNLAELSTWYGAPLARPSAALDALLALLPSHGRALLTLGERGALLVSPGAPAVDYQPAPETGGGHVALGAGDVMFGCLLAARLAGGDWPTALLSAMARTTAYVTRPAALARPYLTLLSPPPVPRGWRLPHDGIDSRIPPAPGVRGGE